MPSECRPEPGELGARTGQVPVFTRFERGPSSARLREVPAHLLADANAAPSDAWAIGPDGSRMWGRDGAAGLLAHDLERGVLLQLRATWSHFGDTWGIPGGALGPGESAYDAAAREANEEAAVPIDANDPAVTLVLDLGYWRYTTLISETVRGFEARITDEESAGLAWVLPDELDRLRLHPGFAGSLPKVRALLGRRPAVIVDAANVVGSRPDGWWRDRAGATSRLVDELAPLAEHGAPGELYGLEADRTWPRIVVVVEGAAASAAVLERELPHRLRLAVADGSGDDRVVTEVQRLRRGDEARGMRLAGPRPVLVVTADRELRERRGARRAHHGPSGLRELLGRIDRPEASA